VEGKVFAFMEVVVGVYSVKLKILKKCQKPEETFCGVIIHNIYKGLWNNNLYGNP